MPGAYDGGTQPGELPDRAPGLDGVEVVGVERDAWRLRLAVHIGHVEAVGDEHHAVALAPEADQPGRVAGQVDDLEAREPVALADGADDMHRAAVPHEAVREGMEQAHVERQSLRSPVVPAAGALRLLDGVWVAEDVGVGTQRRCGAAVLVSPLPRTTCEIPPCGMAAATIDGAMPFSPASKTRTPPGSSSQTR
jgi:hypothetical protein